MTAGELSDHFAVSKPTMSAHFAALREAGLVHAEKSGKSVIYNLRLSVLEDALMGFAHTFGLGSDAETKSTHKTKVVPTEAKEEIS